ncbi:putative transcriptional regulatory protein [Wickerhamomyces ciferrii]|uniref:Transcriptional regulatory protein n=1 Tax=Wickerhamomyces ciferrii (strain ATCC 14091 / BCRC 22168 / CBS 111 / JCM 3599 / NBRC 0793 / NRRL Y-1031 F-60-10) TaxID=1206466 RepID=K0KWL3_WICCF|nr:putative transcriptional regulatory protein [Wickerhamomyces ciferrii]CCH45523.1 putative transcriptional regulatory protein [Wickerhamomyces ciferrii]
MSPEDYKPIRKRSKTSTTFEWDSKDVQSLGNNYPLAQGTGTGNNLESNVSNTLGNQRDKSIGSSDHGDHGKLSKSCDLCKIKKVKCDGVRPICSFCIKNNMKECKYSVMKKPGLKPGYGKNVTSRLDSLEQELGELRNQIASLQNNGNKRTYSSVDKSSQSDQQQHSDHLSKQENNIDTSDTSSENTTTSNTRSFQIPSLLNPVSSVPNGTYNFGLPSSNHCYLLIDIFFKNVNSIFPLLHPNIIMDLEKSVQNTSKGIKPHLLLYAIVLITLKYLNNDQITEEQRSKIYDHCKDHIISTSLKRINIESLQSMILLAFESLSGNVKVPESWNYVSIAADYANYLKLGTENSNKLSITTNDSPGSVNSSSLTSNSDTLGRRKSRSLNNRSINLLTKPQSWIDEESRRHCFWSIYLLDKLYAISSSHDMKLKPNKISCFLPIKLNYWLDVKPKEITQFRTLRSNTTSLVQQDMQSNENSQQHIVEATYDSFTFYIELNKLMGDIHSFSIEEFNINDEMAVEEWKREFSNLDNQMNTWRRSLPFNYQKFLKNGNFSTINIKSQKLEIFDILLFVYYYTTFIKLHSPSGYPHGESTLFKSSDDSKAQCLEAADEVYSFVSQLPTLTNDDDIFEKLGPHFGFYIWINCRILFVDVIYQAQRKGSISDHQKKLSFFANVLKRIGKYWESSNVYFKILEFLHVSDLSYVKTMASTSSPSNSSIHNRSSIISENGTINEGDEDGESSDEQEITDEKREPTKVVTDMRLGSHSLVYWFNKLAGKGSKSHYHPNSINQQVQNHVESTSNSQQSSTQGTQVLNSNITRGGNSFNNTFPLQHSLSNFQTPSIQGFEDFQLTHDDLFNFLALDMNSNSYSNDQLNI